MFPVEEDDGQKFYCLRNPDTPEIPPLVVSELALFILQFFDGNHSVKEIIEIFKAEYNVNLGHKDIENLVHKLDDSLLLESDNYRSYRENVEEEFRGSDVLFPAHSGLCYPADKKELKAFIDNFYHESENHNSKSTGKRVKAVISPHIDYNRGWRSYVKAYNGLEGTRARKFIILGTSHYADTQNPYILTRKSLITPFGTVRTDIEFVEQLEKNCGFDPFENEIAFRTEHSIEFQVIFLQHILGGNNDFTVVPILCNSFDRFVVPGVSPSEDTDVARFIDALKELALGSGDEVIIIAGVDLAHCGPKFGDEKLDDSMLEWIGQRDRLTLSKITELDHEGFYRSVEEEKDRRKICGLSSIYTLLSVTDAKKAEILDYDSALEQNSDAVVTYASAILYD